MNFPFEQLEQNIDKYLVLADRGIVKLLCATVIANRIPLLDPTWLFVVSSSSGGKSELLLALSFAEGLIQKDDITPKTFVSGAKSSSTETSLLFRLSAISANPILVVKDLTVLLKKDSRDTDAIFSQLRMIYDGTFNKSFGTGQDIDVVVRLGLIAGVTSVIEDYQADDAVVGQRAIKYYMKQPPDEVIDDITSDIIAGKEDKKNREMIGNSFKEYLDGNKWETSVLPSLPLELRQDISALSNMATKARSSVKRKAFSRDNHIERKNLREMPFRFAKQLANLARAMMIMNSGPLTTQDKEILFKIALDSIPSSRREVMIAATKSTLGVTLKALATEMRLPEDSAKVHLDDLVAMEIMDRSEGLNKKFIYKLNFKYQELIAKFEHVKAEEKLLDTDDSTIPDVIPPPVEIMVPWDQMEAKLII